MISSNCRNCLHTLADASRLYIWEYLKKLNREATVSEIVGKLELRQPTVTFHLNKMVLARLLKKRRNGREVLLKLRKLSPRCLTCPIYN